MPVRPQSAHPTVGRRGASASAPSPSPAGAPASPAAAVVPVIAPSTQALSDAVSRRGRAPAAAPAARERVEFDSEDEIDLDAIFREFANPYAARDDVSVQQREAAAHRKQTLGAMANDRRARMRFLERVKRRTESVMSNVREHFAALDEQQSQIQQQQQQKLQRPLSASSLSGHNAPPGSPTGVTAASSPTPLSPSGLPPRPQTAMSAGSGAGGSVLGGNMSMMSGVSNGRARTARELARGATDRARSNLLTHIRGLSEIDVKERLVEEAERRISERDVEVEHLRREIVTLRQRVAQAESDACTARAECTSLEDVAAQLRRKIHVVTEREITSQRQLKLFTKLEPLFDQLSSFFNFGSPEEVIARLEDLESTRLDSFSRYTEAEAARAAAERALEQAQRDSASRVQELENALAAERRKGEREVASLRQQLDESHSRFAKTQNIEQQYLTLWNGVIDLFQRWADSELVGEGTPAAARPDVSNPTQLLETIALMFTLKAPSRAADSLRALTGFANVVWLKHFSSQPELKSRPREIYEKLEREVGALRAELARANSGLQQQATQLRAGEQSAADAERRVRALRYELDERQRLIASRFNRPQSAQVMNATAPAATATASSAIASAVASSGVGSAPSNTRAQSASTSRAGTVLDADADAEYFATIDEDDDDEHEGAGDAIAGSLVGASAALGVSSPAHRRSRSAGPVLAVRRDAHAKRQTVATAGSPVPLAFTGQPAGVALAERVRQHHLQQQHPHSAAAQIGRPMSAAALPARHQLTQQMLQLHSTQPALHARPPPPRRPGAAGGVYGSRA